MMLYFLLRASYLQLVESCHNTLPILYFLKSRVGDYIRLSTLDSSFGDAKWPAFPCIVRKQCQNCDNQIVCLEIAFALNDKDLWRMGGM